MAALTGSTIASTYKSLLKMNDITNGVDTTLEAVQDGLGTSSCLQLSTKQFLVKSGTDIDSTFEVQNSAGHQLITVDTVSSPEEVVINEGGLGTIDLRAESDGEDEALFLDSSANALYINKGETAFSTYIGTLNSSGFEGLSVTSAGVIINEDGHAAGDFRVETGNEDEAFFVDSDANYVYINKGEGSVTTSIHSVHDVAVTITSGGVIFNNDGNANNDFRVEGDANTHLLFCDASTDRVCIGQGTATALVTLGSVSTIITDATTSVSTAGVNLHMTEAGKYAMGIKNADASGDGLIIQAGDASDDFALRVQDYDRANDLLAVLGDGNVGIGTTTPISALEIECNVPS